MARATMLPAMSECLSPEPAFRLCACGVLCQERVYVFGTKEVASHWRPLEGLRSPVTGKRHVCAITSEKTDAS